MTRHAHAHWLALMIKASRKKLKLSLRDFAAAVSISTATLSRALTGDSLIDPSTEELLLFKTKGLREAQEVEELLNLTLDHSSYSADNHESPNDPIYDAAESSELALAA